MNLDSAVDGERKSEAQAFRSEVNRSLPLREVARTGAMSRVFQSLGNGVPSTKNDFETLRFYAFTASRSRLAHVGRELDCGIRVEKKTVAGLN